MANILGYENRVRYAIQHDTWGYVEISEPVNWQNDDKEWKRNTSDSYAGIVTKISASIVFTKTGYNTLKSIYEAYGANTDVRLIKDAKDSRTDEWYRVWDGTLDLTTIEIEDSRIMCKFNADQLESVVKSRKSEKYELERVTDLFGNDIDPIPVHTMALDGRKILLESLLNVKPADRDGAESIRKNRNGGRKHTSTAVPISVDYESDFNVQSPQKNYPKTGDVEGDTPLIFYLDADRERKLNLRIEGSMICEVRRVEDVSSAYFSVQLVKYTGGTDLLIDHNSIEVLWDTTDVYGLHNKEIDINFDDQVTVQAGESLGLVFYQTAIFPNWTNFRDGEISLLFNECDVSVSISEDSFVEPSKSKVILPYDAMQQIMKIITGRDNAFYSEALGRTDLGYDQDGVDTGALCGLSHGLWKRGFEQGDELYKPFTTSLSDFMKSYGAVWGLAMGTEKIGYQERIRVEPIDFFYNRNVTIRLGVERNGKFEYTQVNKMQIQFDDSEYYSKIEVGSENVEPYEEIQGLDEYNLKSTFSTVINKIENTLSLLSVYNRDATGGELARRRSKEHYPTEDTAYDNIIYMEDLKRSITDVYQQRYWQDDFESAPKGIFDPSSATNLRLSQVRMILRHGWRIASSLIHYPTNFLRFTSNEGNGKLFTKKASEEVGYGENQDIPNQDLDRPVHKPEFITFEHKVSDEIIAKLDGNSTILGNTFPTKYGLIEFLGSDGQIHRGHLMSLKPNGKGKWKVKKYYNLNQ